LYNEISNFLDSEDAILHLVDELTNERVLIKRSN